MAKKTAKKRIVKKTVTRTVAQKTFVPAISEKNKAAYTLVFIATFFLLVNGFSMIILRKEIASLLGQFGYPVEAVNMATFGVINVVLGTIAWIAVHEVEKIKSRSQMWFLFVIGLLAMVFGGSLLSLVAGVLLTVSSVFYLYTYK